jgi:hypothetical protein
MSVATDLQRIGVKVFGEAPGVAPAEYIPVFHRWIQTHAVDGLLVDVADYTHVPDGPGVLLVAHEGNYAIDFEEGRLGLVYTRKQPLGGSLAERLAIVLRIALRACRRLEEEPELTARVRFSPGEIRFFANDRLVAPNSIETFDALQPALGAVLAAAYASRDWTVLRSVGDPRDRFAVDVRANGAGPVRGILDRLDAVSATGTEAAR